MTLSMKERKSFGDDNNIWTKVRECEADSFSLNYGNEQWGILISRLKLRLLQFVEFYFGFKSKYYNICFNVTNATNKGKLNIHDHSLSFWLQDFETFFQKQ